MTDCGEKNSTMRKLIPTMHRAQVYVSDTPCQSLTQSSLTQTQTQIQIQDSED